MPIISVTRKIHTGRARRLVRNYKKNKWKEGDTKSVYFDSAFCTELIAELRKPGIDGFRIYFGSYEDIVEDPTKKGKTTVIFVTTSNTNNVLESPDDPEIGPDDKALVNFAELNDGSICPPGNCNTIERQELWPNDN